MVSLKKTLLQAQNRIIKRTKGFLSNLIAHLTKKWEVAGIILVGFFLLLPGLVVAGYQVAYLGKVYPGVAVADVKLGNRTEQDAESALEHLAEGANKEQPALTLISEGNQWHILKADIGFSYLPDESARSAYMVGRDGDWLTNLNSQWSAWCKGAN